MKPTVSLATVVEDVLRKHWTTTTDMDSMSSRKGEEAVMWRYEAAGWLRKVAGVVLAKDLPEAPSEEEFRIGLRNGLILCNALNKFHPGAVPKVVVNPGDHLLGPDGAALSAYQYFENVRNFLVAVEELGLPSFEASDLEKGGKSARIVNCVLALKSYCEWKQSGGQGSWKYGGNTKSSGLAKSFMRMNSENFVRTRASHENELSSGEQEETSPSLNTLVRAIMLDKRPEEVPQLVESLLQKVMAEYEDRIANQTELPKTSLNESSKASVKPKASFSSSSVYNNAEVDNITSSTSKKKDYIRRRNSEEEDSSKRTTIFKQQERNIQELKLAVQTTKAGMEFIQTEYNEKFNILGTHLRSLTNAASGYHQVLEENRKLYNQVQDLKGSIRVYCRVRPFLPGQIRDCAVGSINGGNISVVTPPKHGKEGQRLFSFNKVFGPMASQDEVFADTRPLIRSVLDGYNVCIFAYGQTGSGKTYTMSGPNDLSEKTQGVNFRALNDLFKLSEQRKGAFSYEIAVQMIEIYNEQVRDLLVNDGLNKRLEIRNSSQKGLSVPNANLVPVASTSEVIELMNIGQKNRAVSATALNDRSSRSHSCLTVHVQGRDVTSGTVLRGCMHLVDLAGSERVDKSEVTGERLKEAQHINKSLSALGDVIAALAQKSTHVPYRNSKLTQLLQDSLGGQAKTLMFVHISPEMEAIGETLSTLKFAERVSTVELGAARVNKEDGEVKQLREQIASLKAALARKDGGLEHPGNKTLNRNNLNFRTPSPNSFRKGSGDSPGSQTNYRQPMEDVGNIAVKSSPLSRQTKPGFELNGLLTDSPSWPDSSPETNLRGNDDSLSGEWVDKIMVRDDNSSRDPEGLSTPVPDFFYRRYQDSQEPELLRSPFYGAATDDSDDLDIATSDSSEADMQWQQFKDQKTLYDAGSAVRKPKEKPTKGPEVRTAQQARAPSPAKKLPAGSNRGGRQPNLSASGGKRVPSSGKTGNVK